MTHTQEEINNSNEKQEQNDHVYTESNEREKKIKRYLAVCRILLVFISIFIFLKFLNMVGDSYGIDSFEEEYVFWFCVIWAITILMFVFKKKMPSIVARVIDFVKDFIEKRKESKKA